MLPKSRWHLALRVNKKSNVRHAIIEDVEEQNEPVSTHIIPLYYIIPIYNNIISGSWF